MTRAVRGRTKRCSLCRHVKRLDEYYRNRRKGPQGREWRCIPCFQDSYMSGGQCARQTKLGQCVEERALGQRYCTRHMDLAQSQSAVRRADAAFRAVTR